METLKNYHLDLLFGIAFHALTDYEENEAQFEIEKIILSGTLGFKQYFHYRELDFICLSEIKENHQAYLRYLTLLEEKGIFKCCQLQQVIGIFESNQLQIILSTDTGFCYDSASNFQHIKDSLISNKKDYSIVSNYEISTYGSEIELRCAPVGSKDLNLSIPYMFNKASFEAKIQTLKQITNQFFQKISPAVKQIMDNQEDKEFVQEVFQKV